MIIENFQREVVDQESGQLFVILTQVVGQRSLTLSIILKNKLSASGSYATQKKFGLLKVHLYYVDAASKISWGYLN